MQQTAEQVVLMHLFLVLLADHRQFGEAGLLDGVGDHGEVGEQVVAESPG